MEYVVTYLSLQTINLLCKVSSDDNCVKLRADFFANLPTSYTTSYNWSEDLQLLFTSISVKAELQKGGGIDQARIIDPKVYPG